MPDTMTYVVARTTLTRGQWVGIDEKRRPLVTWSGGPEEPVPAQLAANAIPRSFQMGDLPAPVLLVAPHEEPAPPVLVAVIQDTLPSESTPDNVVIEAREGIDIRCGTGRLQIDQSGNVRVKGKTILSRAFGTHRIKGGSVQIN